MQEIELKINGEFINCVIVDKEFDINDGRTFLILKLALLEESRNQKRVRKMSIKQILEKAWEDCRKEGFELSSVTFYTTTCSPFKSRVKEVDFYGLAVEFNEKPQN